jgi:hypothetical protein
MVTQKERCIMVAKFGVAAAVTLMLFPALGGGRAMAQTQLGYRAKVGDRLKYEIQEQMVFGAGKSKFTMDSKLNVEWSVEAIDDAGKATVKFRTTRVRFTSDSTEGQKENFDTDDEKTLPAEIKKDLPALMDWFTVTVDKRGQMTNLKIPANFEKVRLAKNDLNQNEVARQIKESVNPPNLVFPAEPVTKGTSWKTEATLPLGLQEDKCENVFTLQDPVQQAGKALDKILVKVAKTETKTKKTETIGDGFILFDNSAGQLVEARLSSSTTTQPGQVLMLEWTRSVKLQKAD